MRLGARRKWLPVSLTALGLYLLAGCIYVPAFQLPKEGKDFRKMVGGAGSKRPIRPGIDRAAVVRMLGVPGETSADARTIAYHLRATDGYWVWPICFYSEVNSTYYRVKLTFDEADRLVGHEVERQVRHGMINVGSYPPGAPFPPLNPPVRLNPPATVPVYRPDRG